MLQLLWKYIGVPILGYLRNALIKLDIYSPGDWPPPFKEKPSVEVALRGAKDEVNKEKLREQQRLKGGWVFRFVDLVYVALLSKLSHAIEYCALSLHTFIFVVSLFCVLFVTRMNADDYGVHFIADDTFHSVAYFVYFLSNFVMTLNIHVSTEFHDHSDSSCNADFVSFGFFVGFFFSRLVVLVLFLRVIFEDELWKEKKKKLMFAQIETSDKVGALAAEEHECECEKEEHSENCNRCRHYLKCLETCSEYLEENFPKRNVGSSGNQEDHEHEREYDYLDQDTLAELRDAKLHLEAILPVLVSSSDQAHPQAQEDEGDSWPDRVYQDTVKCLSNWTKFGTQPQGASFSRGRSSSGEATTGSDMSFSSYLLEELDSAIIANEDDKESFMLALDACDRALEIMPVLDLGKHENLHSSVGRALSGAHGDNGDDSWSSMRGIVLEEIGNKVRDMRSILQIDSLLESGSNSGASGTPDVTKANAAAWSRFNKLLNQALLGSLGDNRSLGEENGTPGTGSRRVREVPGTNATVRAFRLQLRITVHEMLHWMGLDESQAEAGAPGSAEGSAPEVSKVDDGKSKRDGEGEGESKGEDEEDAEDKRQTLRSDVAKLVERTPELYNFMRQWLVTTREKTLRFVGVVLSRYLAARRLRCEKRDSQDPFLSAAIIKTHLWRYQRCLFVHFYHLLDEILVSKIRYDSQLLIEEQHPHSSADREIPLRRLEAQEDETLLQIVREEVDVNMGWAQFGGSAIIMAVSIIVPLFALLTESVTAGQRILWPKSYKIYAYVVSTVIEIAYSCFKIFCVELQRSPANERERVEATAAGGFVKKTEGAVSSSTQVAAKTAGKVPPAGERSVVRWLKSMAVHDYYDVASEHFEERLREFILFALGEAIILLLLPFYYPTDGTGAMARKVYAVQISACCLLFMLAYLYFHVKTEDGFDDNQEEKEASLEPISQFLSRWLHLLLSLCIFFTASSLGLMYGQVMESISSSHNDDGETAASETGATHRLLGGGGSGSSSGPAPYVKFDHKPLVDGRAVLATSVGTFVLVITVLRSLYTHVLDSKKIFRLLEVCTTCNMIRLRPDEDYLRNHKDICSCEKSGEVPIPETRRLLRLQPGKKRKLGTKLAKLAFAVLHFGVGFANIEQANWNILLHFLLLAISAITGGKSPWIFNAFRYLVRKQPTEAEKFQAGKRQPPPSKNCHHCGIKRGINVCPVCHAKEAPQKLGLRNRRGITNTTLGRSASRFGNLNTRLTATPFAASAAGTINPLLSQKRVPPDTVSISFQDTYPSVEMRENSITGENSRGSARGLPDVGNL